jgi:hypothetical protein
MMRFAKASLVPAGALLAIATLVLGPPPAGAQGKPKPMPPHSKAFGKTLTEWLKLHDTWDYGGDQGDTVGHVRFLPGIIPVPDDPRLTEIDGFAFYVDEFDVSLKPGTAFVLNVFGVVAETYLEPGVPDDDIHDPEILAFLRQFFGTAEVLVKLDGRPILDSRVENLLRYVSDPYDFDETLLYDVPKVGLIDPGPPPVFKTSIGAIGGQAMGFVYPPLPVGDHVLEVFVKADEFDFFSFGSIATYRITVRP